MKKKNREEILKKYLEDKIKKILKETFDINEINKFEAYESFFTQERIYDINTFKGYGLISTQIYNAVYLYLRYSLNYEKDYIINKLQPQVDFNEEEMKKIKENKWSINDYRDYNYKLSHPEEYNDIRASTEKYEESTKQEKKNIVVVTVVPENIIPINDYRYCTNCGLMLNGQLPTVMGVKIPPACNCSQRSKPIYNRNKSYCDKCGNFLKYSYCSYCGVKNY